MSVCVQQGMLHY